MRQDQEMADVEEVDLDQAPAGHSERIFRIPERNPAVKRIVQGAGDAEHRRRRIDIVESHYIGYGNSGEGLHCSMHVLLPGLIVRCRVIVQGRCSVFSRTNLRWGAPVSSKYLLIVATAENHDLEPEFGC